MTTEDFEKSETGGGTLNGALSSQLGLNETGKSNTARPRHQLMQRRPEHRDSSTPQTCGGRRKGEPRPRGPQERRQEGPRKPDLGIRRSEETAQQKRPANLLLPRIDETYCATLVLGRSTTKPSVEPVVAV